MKFWIATYYATSLDYLTNKTDIKKPYPPGKFVR